MVIRAWQIRWVLRYLCSRRNYRHQTTALVNVSAYYVALLRALLPRRFFKPTRLKLVSGPEFVVNDLMTLHMYQEIFIDRAYDVGLTLRPSPTIIDIGANVGIFTLWTKQLWPESNVLCFEPQQANFSALIRNLELNEVKGVTVYRVGISSRCTQKQLHLHPKNPGGHSLYPSVTGGREVDEIDVDLESVLCLTSGLVDSLRLTARDANTILSVT